MKLKSLTVDRGWNAEAPLRCEVRFIGDDGDEIKTKLDEELSREVVRACADALARAGKRAATALTADSLRQTAIEHQSD